MPLLTGRATLRVEEGNEREEWDDDLLFYDYGTADDRSVILGHTGFLEFFTATFDGAAERLTLIHNGRRP